MSGHSKWSQIKRQKGATDAARSKLFTKHARFISVESKKSNGAMSASLLAVIENAKKDNVPKDVIERAVKKGSESGSESMDAVTYESYGPGGTALIIEALTSNRNKTAQEVKHVLTKNGFALAAQGSASWAFTKSNNTEWTATLTVPLSDEDLSALETLVDELENLEEVQEVFTNAE